MFKECSYILFRITGRGRLEEKIKRFRRSRRKTIIVVVHLVCKIFVIPVLIFIVCFPWFELKRDITSNPIPAGIVSVSPHDINLTIHGSSRVGIYSENSKSLMKSLVKAVNKGCRIPSMQIEIILMRDSMPHLKQYILFQMEQTYGMYINDQYLELMRNAVQVWFFSPIMLEQAREKFAINRGFYVPLFLTVDAENPQYQCYKRKSRYISPGIYQLYFNKTYVTATVQDENTLTINSIPSLRPKDLAEMEQKVLNAITNFDILFFGEIQGSHQNQRESLCNNLVARGFKLVCVQRTVGAPLEHLVCRAKVIVVDSYHPNGSLSAHRIDPLILSEKVVLAKHSYDPYLDMVYSPAIEFTNDADLYRKVSLILRDYDEYQRQMVKKKINFVNHMNSLNPLCYALSHLP